MLDNLLFKVDHPCMLFKIGCKACNGHVEFDENELGATIACPHCGNPLKLAAVLQKKAAPPFTKRKSAIPKGLIVTIIALSGAVLMGLLLFVVVSKPVNTPNQGKDRGIASHACPFMGGRKFTIANTSSYFAELQKGYRGSDMLTCDLTFRSDVPPGPAVDKLLKECLEKCVEIDNAHEILAMAFLNDDALKHQAYSGPLVWKPNEQKIITMEEEKRRDRVAQGLKSIVEDKGTYLLKKEEEQTHSGVKPARKWLILKLVYTSQPAIEQAYADLVNELSLSATSGMDVDGYVLVGDKGDTTSWKQIRDPDFGYVTAHYSSETRIIEKPLGIGNSRFLKKL